MPYEGMTIARVRDFAVGSVRDAAGRREILECCLEGRPVREEYLTVDGGKLAGTGADSYTVKSA